MKSESSTWTLRDITAAAIAIGLFSGAVFASSDLLMNRAIASMAQCAQFLVMSAMCALLAAARYFRRRPDTVGVLRFE